MKQTSRTNFFFPTTTLDSIRFENELSGLSIEFEKTEILDVENIPCIQYTVSEQNVEIVAQIMDKIEKEAQLVPKKKIVIITDEIWKWFARIALFVGAMLSILEVIKLLGGHTLF